MVAFQEFFGDDSIAGKHEENDPKRLVLIDVSIDSRILPPEELLFLFEG